MSPFKIGESKCCRADVSSGSALLLAQGYPFTGFVVINKDDAMCWPPGIDAKLWNGWNLFWDLRLFGDRGEWHLWRTNDGQWKDRLASPERPEWKDHHIARADVLWGKQKGSEENDGISWIRYSETRGACVWVPEACVEKDRPARLHLWQRIECDGNGIAGVVDVMLRGIDSEEEAHA